MTGCTISIVIPTYNESTIIQLLLQQVSKIMNKLDQTYEIIVVDDGSIDATTKNVRSAVKEHPQIQLIELSRNFGKEAALAAGMTLARGKCVIFMDADLQHPPAIIPSLYTEWVHGAHVVNAVKRERGKESRVHKILAKIFNQLMTTSVGTDMSGASDFKLLDRQVVDVLLACPERNRFFRGLVAWVGFEVKSVSFDVQERPSGATKWTLKALIRYTILNFVAFSSLPLRLVAYAGFIVTLFGLLLVGQTLINWVSGNAEPGFTTIITLQVFLDGMILTALGVISIYLSRIYEEQKSRPLFVIKDDTKRARELET